MGRKKKLARAERLERKALAHELGTKVNVWPTVFDFEFGYTRHLLETHLQASDSPNAGVSRMLDFMAKFGEPIDGDRRLPALDECPPRDELLADCATAINVLQPLLKLFDAAVRLRRHFCSRGV